MRDKPLSSLSTLFDLFVGRKRKKNKKNISLGILVSIDFFFNFQTRLPTSGVTINSFIRKSTKRNNKED